MKLLWEIMPPVSVFITDKSACSTAFRTRHAPAGIRPHVRVFVCISSRLLNLHRLVRFPMHNITVLSYCLYSVSALFIHLCISPPKDEVFLSLSLSITCQPLDSHTFPPTFHPLVGLIIACHFATPTYVHTYTHTCLLLAFSPSAVLLFFHPLLVATFMAFQPF